MAEDLQRELGLSRPKLVAMALLLGSDYTDGVHGVGIVNASEIVNSFCRWDPLTILWRTIRIVTPSAARPRCT